MISQAAKETGLSEKQVKDWISNHNKPPKVSKRDKLYLTKPRAYDVFRKKYFKELEGTVYDPQIALAKANEKWGQISKFERKIYEDEAEAVVVADFHELPIEDQRSKINDTRKKISRMCQELDGYGVEVLVMDYDTNDERATKEGVNSCGSLRSASFLEAENRLEWRFAQFMDGILGKVAEENQEPRQAARKEVVDLLNNKIRALQIGRTTVPYKAIVEGSVEVIGLPEGFHFRNPALMTKKELILIKENIDNISFLCPKPRSNESELEENEGESDDFFDIRMEDFCEWLKPDDYVPNSLKLRVTLRQVVEKDKKGEGYIEKILDHYESTDGYMFSVKWVAYKEPTWTKGDGIPEEDLQPYKKRYNLL
ncbi:uncharacterized protein [Clytia hemisphaerica]|uniref:Uncharacterized protein n=1 Tax=Clytia hemisphaerica TaxID=252671 RepID=A0A7M5UUC8_9CNID